MSDDPGPTGKFPRGKITEHDDGELCIAFEIRDGAILMHFGTPISWFGMTAEHADAYALNLRVLARQLREEQGL